MTDEIRRTAKGWTHYLGNEDEPLTLAEYQAGVASRMLGALIEIAQAMGHAEGILTAVDDTLARRDPEYARDGERRHQLVSEAREQRRALEGR